MLEKLMIIWLSIKLYILMCWNYPEWNIPSLLEKVDKELEKNFTIGIIDFSKDDAILDAIMWER